MLGVMLRNHDVKLNINQGKILVQLRKKIVISRLEHHHLCFVITVTRFSKEKIKITFVLLNDVFVVLIRGLF